MAIYITEECINCGACEPECPNTAIYEPGARWAYGDGTTLKGDIDFGEGVVIGSEDMQAPVNEELYYIVPSKCTECMGFHEEPQCAAVCPVDCCVPDPDNEETEETLLAKQSWMHAEA